MVDRCLRGPGPRGGGAVAGSGGISLVSLDTIAILRREAEGCSTTSQISLWPAAQWSQTVGRAQAEEHASTRGCEGGVMLSCEVLLEDHVASFVKLLALGVGTSRDLDGSSNVAVFEVALLINN